MAYIDKINKNSTDYDIQDSKAARSVDGTTASHVEEANQIYTATGVLQSSDFIYRTTAGDASINTGTATILSVKGRTEQIGHAEEVKEVEWNFQNDVAPSIDWNRPQWRSASSNGVWIFTYDATDNPSFPWSFTHGSMTGITTTLLLNATWGVNITEPSELVDGDSFAITFTYGELGTLNTATPTSFVATGYNQYDAVAGYAHVVGNNQYRISGTYSSLGFATTVGGTTTAVTVTNNKFTPTEDGYIYVNGGSGDILIALVWSGVRDSDPFEAFETSTVTIPTSDASSNPLPTASYGMPSVGDVADELNFADKQYVQRIGHYTYSAENLATVEALGVDYTYDLSDIFYVLETPVVFNLASTVQGSYTANDFGTEEFVGTNASVEASLYYGNNLVDKLRNLADIQSIGTGLTLTDGELSASGGGGGSSYNVYSTKATSNSNRGGAVYMGNLNASQEQFEDPTTSGTVKRYFHALPYSNTITPGDKSIVIGAEATSANRTGYIGIGFSSTCEANNVINIGGSYGRGTASVIIGKGAKGNSNTVSSVAIGEEAGHTSYGGTGCISLGAYSSATRQGEMNVGATNSSYGFNNTNYRLISGVYDGSDNHDAATVAQGNKLMTAAPTSSDAGVLGQLWTDTTGMHTYQCTAISGSTYTWTQRW